MLVFKGTTVLLWLPLNPREGDCGSAGMEVSVSACVLHHHVHHHGILRGIPGHSYARNNHVRNIRNNEGNRNNPTHNTDSTDNMDNHNNHHNIGRSMQGEHMPQRPPVNVGGTIRARNHAHVLYVVQLLH